MHDSGSILVLLLLMRTYRDLEVWPRDWAGALAAKPFVSTVSRAVALMGNPLLRFVKASRAARSAFKKSIGEDDRFFGPTNTLENQINLAGNAIF